MSENCGRINPACAHAFQEIVVQYATLNERYAAMDSRLAGISKAVIGNGNTHDSLACRVERLESSAATAERCGDRFWKVFGVGAAVAAVVVAILK